MSKKLIIVLIIIGYACNSWANTFLYNVSKHSFSVKSHGMATAGVAFAEEEAATLINPASLGYPGSAYSFQKLDYDNVLNKTYQAHYYYNSPLGISSLIKEDQNGNKLTLTSIGLGFFADKSISWGINYKSIHGNAEGEDIQGWSSDLGIICRLTQNLNAGLNIRDLYAKNLNLNQTFEFGLTSFLQDSNLAWSIDTIYENNTNKKVYIKTGGEISLTKSLNLRAGIDRSTLHSGASLTIPFVNLDFGMSNNLDDTSGTYYSFATRFGQGSQFANFRKRYAIYKPKTYAEFAIGNNTKSGRSQISLLNGKKVGSNDLLTLINLANQDKSCQGYIIRLGNLASSLTSVGLIEEIRTELLKAKNAGKHIFIYLEGHAGLPEYYLASIADIIIMPPMGSMSQFGLNLEITKAADFLEKLGIKQQIFESGDQKSATSTFSESLSSLDRYQIKSVIETIFQQVLTDIETIRPKSNSGITNISDGSMISAKEAKELGLVDQLAYWPNVYDIVDDFKEGIERTKIKNFIPLYQPTFIQLHNKIAVIEIDGSILLGNNTSNVLFGGQSTGAEDFERIVAKIKENPIYKGVILRINSPGGSILASDRIYHAINTLKDAGKTVYTSMGSIATSGGYYIATNSDKIYANKASITGSIGVISSWWSTTALSNELGIKNEQLSTGKYMGIYSPNTPLSQQSKQMIQQHQDRFYQEFVNKVRNNRKLTSKESYSISQGQFFSGNQASNMKLVDEIGNFYDTVDGLALELNIDEPELIFIRPESSFSIPSILRQTVQAFNLNNERFKSIQSILTTKL